LIAFFPATATNDGDGATTATDCYPKKRDFLC
jgi:hypothetical protein